MNETSNKYMVQIKQEHYEELLERDAWFTALEDAYQSFDEDYSPTFEEVGDLALEIYNKRNEVASEPMHLRLISKIESGDNSPAIAEGSLLKVDAPSSVQHD